MGLEDITGKAQDFLNDNTVKDALNSQQAEDISDKLLDGVAGVADKITGGKFADQIDGARDAADGAVGTEK
jgi:MT0933-like antitoxin protein